MRFFSFLSSIFNLSSTSELFFSSYFLPCRDGPWFRFSFFHSLFSSLSSSDCWSKPCRDGRGAASSGMMGPQMSRAFIANGLSSSTHSSSLGGFNFLNLSCSIFRNRCSCINTSLSLCSLHPFFVLITTSYFCHQPFHFHLLKLPLQLTFLLSFG